MLAAVDYYLPIYRSVTAHAALATSAVKGGPEGRSPRELHAAAWEIVAPMFTSARHHAEERLRSALATGRAVTDAGEVVEAAQMRRVEVLFLPDDGPVWGRVGNGHVQVNAQRQPGDIEVLERAAVETLAAAGSLYVHAPEDIPVTAAAAAVLRW